MPHRRVAKRMGELALERPTLERAMTEYQQKPGLLKVAGNRNDYV